MVVSVVDLAALLPVAGPLALVTLANDVLGLWLVEWENLLPVGAFNVANFEVVAALVLKSAVDFEVVIMLERMKLVAGLTGPKSGFVPRVATGASIVLALHHLS